MIDSPLGQLVGALGAVVVLDVAGAALGIVVIGSSVEEPSNSAKIDS